MPSKKISGYLRKLFVYIIFTVFLGGGVFFILDQDKAQAQASSHESVDTQAIRVSNTVLSGGGKWQEGLNAKVNCIDAADNAPLTQDTYVQWGYKHNNHNDNGGKKYKRKLRNPNLPYSMNNPYICDFDPNAPDYRDNITQNRGSLNQKPYLILGHDPDYDEAKNSGGIGIHNPVIKIDLWIPDSTDIEDVKLETEDLCFNDNLDLVTNSTSAETKIYIKGKAGNETKINEAEFDDFPLVFKSTMGNTCSDIDVTNPINTSNLQNLTPGEERQLLDRNNNTEKEYKKYAILITVDKESLKSNSGALTPYYNQFRISLANPTEGYLSFPSTIPQPDILQTNATGVSNRAKNFVSGNADDDLMVLWEITFEVAADANLGCNDSVKGDIGLYDLDYPTSNDWRGTEVAPSVDISYTDRNSYLSNSQNPMFTLLKPPLKFNGTLDQGEKSYNPTDGVGADVSANKWEAHTVAFDNNKVYRIRLYNLSSPSWLQIALPFEQVNSLQKCVLKPLVKVNYSDVSAGGRFGMGEGVNACMDQTSDLQEDNIKGNIYTHSTTKNASSAQYAVYANDEIIGFYSNFTGTPLPSPKNTLTFANNPPSSDWGGQLGGNGRCIPNYWRGADSLVVNNNSAHVDIDAAAEDKLYKPNGGSLTLTANSPYANLKKTLYVEGDLIIKENITNNGGAIVTSWTSFNQIGYIYLIVKGDILIDPSVTKIDAILVAMPNDDDNKKGRIYTCYHDTVKTQKALDSQISNDTDSKDYANDCVNKLTVNGALIAQEVHLGRVVDSNPLNPSPLDREKEEINLLPEYFVGTPLLPIFPDWVYSSDSTAILPPNF